MGLPRQQPLWGWSLPQQGKEATALIGTALSYIRKRLDAHLREAQGAEAEGDSKDRVVFLEGDKLDPLVLTHPSLTMLVVNVKEDRECWDADRFQRRLANGKSDGSGRHYPDIHLELAILFVANFNDYATAWNQLSEVLYFFQQHPVIDRDLDSNLPKGIDRLTNELCSQSFQEQNELWGALRTSLRPALLHRFRLITFRGVEMAQQVPPIEEEKIQIRFEKEDKWKRKDK